MIVLGLVCVTFPSQRYFADSLDYAYNMDNSTGWIVHPHHPLIPLLPHILFKLLGGIGSGLKGLDIMMFWSMMAGLTSSWAILIAVRRMGLSIATMILVAGLFAFSRGVWYFTVTPNQHSTSLMFCMLALLPMLLALRRYPDGPDKSQVILMAVMTSLGILTSKLNAGLILPATYLIFANRMPMNLRYKNLAIFLATVGIVTAGLFIVLGAGFLRISSIQEFIAWQNSYVYETRWWPNSLIDGIQRN